MLHRDWLFAIVDREPSVQKSDGFAERCLQPFAERPPPCGIESRSSTETTPTDTPESKARRKQSRLRRAWVPTVIRLNAPSGLPLSRQ